MSRIIFLFLLIITLSIQMILASDEVIENIAPVIVTPTVDDATTVQVDNSNLITKSDERGDKFGSNDIIVSKEESEVINKPEPDAQISHNNNNDPIINEQQPEVQINNKPTINDEEPETPTMNDFSEEDSVKEILEAQEDDSQQNFEEMDRIEIEKAQKHAELLQEQETKEKQEKQNKNKESDSEWVKRSRPGSQSKPGANLKTAKTGVSEDVSSANNRERVPKSSKTRSNAGSYYGGNQESEDLLRKQEEAQKKKEKNKFSSGAGDRRREVEKKIGIEVRARASLDQQQREEKENEIKERRKRYRLPRTQARPVETVLRVYNDPETDLYQVIGVSNDVDDFTLKKKYRNVALSIHPDKNPHPDAKIAFDSLQDAFDTLSSPIRRSEYDKNLLIKRRTKSLTKKRVVKIVNDFFKNQKSRLLLLIYHFKQGNIHEEIDDFQQKIESIVTGFRNVLEHFVFLPSAIDRVKLWNELFERHLIAIIISNVFVSSLIFNS